MNNNNSTNPLFKVLFLLVGLGTFFVGLLVASQFSAGFSSRFVSIGVFLLVVGFVVYKFRKGSCCG